MNTLIPGLESAMEAREPSTTSASPSPSNWSSLDARLPKTWDSTSKRKGSGQT